MTDEIHDMSRVDAFMASRRRAMIFHSVWKPMLAGAVGAAIMAATVIGSVWVILPKITVHDVVVDHVIQKDVPFDNHVPQEKPFDNFVPQTKPFDVPKPVADASPKPQLGPDSPYAPKTPEEQKFTSKPEYKDATYRGRIVKSRDGRSLSFEDGQDFGPAHWDKEKGQMVDDPLPIKSDEFIGDLGMCVPRKNEGQMYDCNAMHNGKLTPIGGSNLIGEQPTSPDQRANAGEQTRSASAMVMVDVNVAGYPVEAMVDTGCSFPMSVPKVYADALMRVGLAERTGAATSILADGSEQSVDMIVIKQITVDGRTLQNVAASVAPSDNAPILLGLGALNRLGPYSIQEGRLVFTGEQPA